MEYLTPGGWGSLAALAWLVFFIGAATLAGTLVTRGARVGGLNRGEALVFSAGAGLLVLSAGILYLGMADKLGRPWLAALTISFILAAVLAKTLPPIFFVPPAKLSRLFLSVAAAMFALSLVGALSPPIGTDALSYHLTHPKMFLENGSAAYLPGTRESLWPYHVEMLFTLGLAFGGTALATLFHWIYFPLTACAVYFFTRRFSGETQARWAAAVFIFTPAVFSQAGYAYVDLAFGFYLFCAGYAFFLYDRDEKTPYLLLAGLFFGGALATKYFAISALAVFLPMIVWRTRSIGKTAVFLGGCAVFGAIWYARSWAILGNPVYPFFTGVFGAGLESDIAAPGVGTGPAYYPALLWNMTLRPGSFGGELLGPLYLMFIPAALIRKTMPSRAGKYFIFFCVAFSAVLFKQAQYVRFFLALVPFLAVGTGIGIARSLSARAPYQQIVAGCLALTLTSSVGIGLYRARAQWAVVLGASRPADYLERYDRSYRGHAFLRASMKPGERAFNAAEARQFYGDLSRIVTDNAFFRKELEKRGKTLESYLKEEKFEYLWLSRDTKLYLWEFASNEGYREVFSYEFYEKPGSFRYCLLKRV